MKFSDIHLRDPYILPYEGKYYLIGTPGKFAWHGACGFLLYCSDDLNEWSEPVKCFEAPDGFWADRNFWAPELHVYRGRFYIFAAFKGPDHVRAVQILSSDRIEGPYEVWSDPVTPPDWECLDGTLFVEDGVPYMVFCHEWSQIGNGEMCLIRLSDDLKSAVGEPSRLFRASDDPSVRTIHEGKDDFVTDGPFLFRSEQGRLLMLWSSFGEKGYLEAVAVSESGSVKGPWKHLTPISEEDGGHGMIFTGLDGKLHFTMHRPNSHGLERPVIFTVTQTDTEPYLKI